MATAYEQVLTPKGGVLEDSRQESYQLNLEEEAYKKMSTPKKIVVSSLYLLFALASLFVFTLAIKLFGNGFTLWLACDSKSAFKFADNPVAGLMVGTLATALLHSSSTITSITVALVGSGGMTISQGVYVIMGANIGTCITCIMVAFGQVGDRTQFERAMAAATVHDMYNIWSVMIMFPIEIIFHPLEKIAKSLSGASASGGEFKSPVDTILKPITDWIMVLDKKNIEKVPLGKFTCTDDTTFIKGGWFDGSSISDSWAAAIVVGVGLVLLVISLVSLVKMLSKLFLGPTRSLVSKMLNYNGYVNIIAGTIVTFLVHSSTLVTSTITPMAGMGIITLEQVYPIVIGANLGTCGTAQIAAMVTGKKDAVAIAFVHTIFNVAGIFLFYPIPATRRPILSWARSLAFFSAAWPVTAVLFLMLMFIIVPGILLIAVILVKSSSTLVVIIGILFIIICVASGLGALGWYFKLGGQEKWHRFLEQKRSEREFQEASKAEAAIAETAV